MFYTCNKPQQSIAGLRPSDGHKKREKAKKGVGVIFLNGSLIPIEGGTRHSTCLQGYENGS